MHVIRWYMLLIQAYHGNKFLCRASWFVNSWAACYWPSDQWNHSKKYEHL